MTARTRATLAAAAVFVCVWPWILRLLGDGDLYAIFGPFSVVLIAVLGALAGPTWWRRALAHRFWRNFGIGALVGAVMTVGTYGAYAVGAALVPSLAGEVEGLYRAAHPTSFGAAFAWTLVVIAAEEILWRGPVLDGLPEGRARPIVVALSLVTYTAVQVGTGSWVVALAALVCGLFWMAERLRTRSIVAPLVSHTIWTMTVIHLYPVTALAAALYPSGRPA